MARLKAGTRAHFQGRPARSKNPLSTLDESVIVADDVANLDDVRMNSIFQHFDSLKRDVKVPVSTN